MQKKSGIDISISYKQAIALPDKAFFDPATYVKWSRQAEQEAPRKEIDFYSIGRELVMFPPKLPFGYHMETHSSWKDLIKRIFDPEIAITYSFDYMDGVIADLQKLYDLNIGRRAALYLNRHPKYPLYCKEYDEAWGDLQHSIDELCELAINEPAVPERGVKQERRSPPTKIEVLRKMLEIAESEAESTQVE